MGARSGLVSACGAPVFRPSNSTFYFRYTPTQGNADAQFIWYDAGSGWLPVSGDFKLDEFDPVGG